MFDQEVELEFGNPSLNMDMEAEGGNAGVGVDREQESAVGSDQASSASLMEGQFHIRIYRNKPTTVILV